GSDAHPVFDAAEVDRSAARAAAGAGIGIPVQQRTRLPARLLDGSNRHDLEHSRKLDLGSFGAARRLAQGDLPDGECRRRDGRWDRTGRWNAGKTRASLRSDEWLFRHRASESIDRRASIGEERAAAPVLAIEFVDRVPARALDYACDARRSQQPR